MPAPPGIITETADMIKQSARRACIITAFIAACSALQAQTNLVPNPGFEDYNTCPTGFSDVLYNDVSFPFVLNWFSATQFGTSDYFNACAPYATSVSVPNTVFWGHNPTRHCSGMCGLFTYQEGSDYREYIEVKLTDTLQAGESYYVEFYISPVEYQNAAGGYYDFILAIDEIGAALTADKIMVPFSSLPLSIEPQIENVEGNYLSDSSQWYKISGNYIAAGGEQYLTIGNFKDNDETNYIFMNGPYHTPGVTMAGYVFVDDVMVTSGDIIPQQISFCEGALAELIAEDEGEGYLWSTGDTTRSISVDIDGTYSVMVDYGCDTADYYFEVSSIPVNINTSFNEDRICESEFPVTLMADTGFTSSVWSTGETADSITVDSSGTYWVVSNLACDLQVDTFVITALDPGEFTVDLGTDTLFCTNDAWSFVLDATDDFDTYDWSTGAHTPSIEINAGGVYSVVVTNICGSWSDTINILSGSLLEKPDLGDDLMLCAEQGIPEVMLSAAEQNCDYTWSNGATGASITVSDPGDYILTCLNNCGSETDTISVLSCNNIFMPNAFSPNGDGINDVFMPVTYPALKLISFSVYNRWGELLFYTQDRTAGWDGTFKNASMPVGSYTYVVQYDQSGYTEQQQGSFTLLH